MDARTRAGRHAGHRITRGDISAGERAVAAILGSALAFLGIRRRSPAGMVMVLGSGAMLLHSLFGRQSFNRVLRSRSAAAVGAIVAVLGWGLMRSNFVAASPAAAVTRCQNVQLAIQPGQSNAGVGHVGIQYRVINTSQRTCQLYGYPGVVLLDANFSTLPTHLRRSGGYLGGSPQPRLVVLAPGKAGYFFLEWVHIPATGQTCPQARYLMIIPPNDFLPDVTWAANGGSITPCGGNVVVSPLEPKPIF